MHKTIWFKIHWILGITAGIVLFVVGVTGATLSFEKEITRFINQDSFYVTASTEPKLSSKELLEKFQANNPKAKINSILSSDLNKKIINHSFWILLGNVISKFILLIATILMARYLGKEEYGQFGIIKSTILMFAMFAGM